MYKCKITGNLLTKTFIRTKWNSPKYRNILNSLPYKYSKSVIFRDWKYNYEENNLTNIVNMNLSNCNTPSSNKKTTLILDKAIKKFPSSAQPYLYLARIDKPTGTILLLWPCFWSIALAAEPNSLPSFYYLTLFGLGAFLMRGAGCTINDMWDKNLDSKVERTKNRPIASGVLSRNDALAFLALQLSFSSVILLQLNWYSILLGASSMILVVTYPISKRFTNWPQLVLGFTFNWGALLGFSAVRGACDWPLVIPLYLAGISWTMVYDTIYALQDRDEDRHVGIKSTALMFGKDTKKWLSAFSTSMVANLLLLGYLDHQTWPYYVSVVLVASHLSRQIITLKENLQDDCQEKFKSNQTLGLLLFIGILSGSICKDKISDKESSEKNNSQLNISG